MNQRFILALALLLPLAALATSRDNDTTRAHQDLLWSGITAPVLDYRPKLGWVVLDRQGTLVLPADQPDRSVFFPLTAEEASHNERKAVEKDLQQPLDQSLRAWRPDDGPFARHVDDKGWLVVTRQGVVFIPEQATSEAQTRFVSWNAPAADTCMDHGREWGQLVRSTGIACQQADAHACRSLPVVEQAYRQLQRCL